MAQARLSMSIVIPARNEVALIASTVASVLLARDRYHEACIDGDVPRIEILVIDNASDDGTAGVLAGFSADLGVQTATCEPRGAARARNFGAQLTTGRLLVFLDADTHMPADGLARIADLVEVRGFEAGITRLGSLDGGGRARCWWAFWNAVRLLPLPRAKAMPACMFCTRGVFDEFGPFDERVAIGEEWPILAGLYRNRRERFVYDRSLTALSSARRMELQSFGYARTLARYVWAVLDARGRVNYPDHVRHTARDSSHGDPPPGTTCPKPKALALGMGPGPSSPGWAERLGPWLGKIRLHVVEPGRSPGRPPTIAKRRLWFSPLLIGPVNLSLRLLRARVRVLPRSVWHTRERALHRMIYGIELEPGRRGWLTFPQWPGVVLAEYARNPESPAIARLRGLAAASRALRDLHRTEWRRADGARDRLSHGDATLRNVLFDPETGRARWFDFDTDHDPRMAPAWRHGDDLRAMVYSAVESFDDLPVAQLLEAVRETYPDLAPWEQLRLQLDRGLLHRSPLHFAQACPSPGRRRELESLLLRGDGPCGFRAGPQGESIESSDGASHSPRHGPTDGIESLDQAI